jgi:hypothetical protein
MPVRHKDFIKRTVSIHPEIDRLIKKTWAILLQKGYRANYSTVLQLMVLSAVKGEPLTEEELKKLDESIEKILKESGKVE